MRRHGSVIGRHPVTVSETCPTVARSTVTESTVRGRLWIADRRAVERPAGTRSTEAASGIAAGCTEIVVGPVGVLARTSTVGGHRQTAVSHLIITRLAVAPVSCLIRHRIRTGWARASWSRATPGRPATGVGRGWSGDVHWSRTGAPTAIRSKHAIMPPTSLCHESLRPNPNQCHCRDDSHSHSHDVASLLEVQVRDSKTVIRTYPRVRRLQVAASQVEHEFGPAIGDIAGCTDCSDWRCAQPVSLSAAAVDPAGFHEQPM